MTNLRWLESSFIQESAPYQDVNGLHPFFDRLRDRDRPAPLILVGPSGVAKSLAVRSYSWAHKIPMVVTDGSEDLRRHHLIGSRIIEGDSTPFVCGDMLHAVQVANTVGQCIYLVEEINACSPYTQKLFNALTGDGPQVVLAPEIQMEFRVREGAKLWVVGTMNRGTKYGGIYTLNEDLKRRFRMMLVGYPDKKVERVLLKTLVPKAAFAEIDKLLTLAEETRSHGSAYTLSTGDLHQILLDAQNGGVLMAIRTGVIGKYDDGDYDWFAKRVSSILGG